MDCQRPGCTGTIEDGYCSVCGMAPQKGAMAAAPQSLHPPTTGQAPSARASQATRGTTSGGTARRAGWGRPRRGTRGAGLVEVPPVPSKDPTSVVLANPEVEESKRYC